MLIISLLAPLGVVDVTGPLAPRIALLVVPALVAEELDLHILTLHSAPGILAGVVVHLPGFLFLAGGLAWRARLPDEGETDVGSAAGCSEHRVRRVR
jgi:hypothetical protein